MDWIVKRKEKKKKRKKKIRSSNKINILTTNIPSQGHPTLMAQIILIRRNLFI